MRYQKWLERDLHLFQTDRTSCRGSSWISSSSQQSLQRLPPRWKESVHLSFERGWVKWVRRMSESFFLYFVSCSLISAQHFLSSARSPRSSQAFLLHRPHRPLHNVAAAATTDRWFKRWQVLIDPCLLLYACMHYWILFALKTLQRRP